MRRFGFTRAPRDLSRRGVKLDNIALIPASLLPYKAYWQQVANNLPAGDILIVLPFQAKPQRIARSVASHLREKGNPVRVWVSCQSRCPRSHTLFGYLAV